MDTLIDARKVADYVLEHWTIPKIKRETAQPVSKNIAAILADAILQSGLNYRAVVFPRVCAIARAFPKLDSLSRLQKIVTSEAFSMAFAWTHNEKPRRLRTLINFLLKQGLETISDIRQWLRTATNRSILQSIKGIGPKTVDYLARLVGLSVIAVDRHAFRLLNQAGVRKRCYHQTRRILEYAADLLEMSRSLFDQLIWSSLSAQK